MTFLTKWSPTRISYLCQKHNEFSLSSWTWTPRTLLHLHVPLSFAICCAKQTNKQKSILFSLQKEQSEKQNHKYNETRLQKYKIHKFMFSILLLPKEGTTKIYTNWAGERIEQTQRQHFKWRKLQEGRTAVHFNTIKATLVFVPSFRTAN